MINIALVHYPVLNRSGETIASAVTNLDIHDIARVARTWGVAGYYVVTPLAEQQALVAELIGHWTGGVGGEMNPDRRSALELVRIAGSLKDVREDVALKTSGCSFTYATTARNRQNSVRWSDLRKGLVKGRDDLLLVFGTASGLAEQVFDEVDGAMEPIRGIGEYNHLSVRSAVAIALDRLLSSDRDG
ncbi:MAG: RNA methyltransferase [Desulfobacteraceae bacterium]|nr:RNA methyltransferase [Desulfobacteraceae bacterium]